MEEETVFWYYKSDINPWPNVTTDESKLVEWTKYRDIEIDLIEETYHEKKLFVLLDRYKIDFERFIQINLNDETKQRPVKREKGSIKKECLRENRFASTILFVSNPSSSYNNADAWCPFLTAWFQTSRGQQAFLHFPKCVEACAQGIVQEAALHNSYSETEAKYMAKKLRQSSNKSCIELSEMCIRFYTKDSFLYYVLNKALREQDYSKLDTLGPFCYILRLYSRRLQNYIGTVYRGVELDFTTVEAYKKHVGEWKSWPAFTSTSKDRQMAEMFGNTLFIIEIADVKLSSPRTYDISHISSYPHEEEILLPAGISFQILKVEQDPTQKYIIHLKV
ncbi:unnamed protein product [Adineta ricciae]|uniref:NAD(P)(+)--arginine ADP-ribosyltransferase n=1 Tax=Adineta ricciae TaxID=249248 RepID=A0A815ZPS8_ADIRI|nr:unnamed protein product [Adineta ricciae]CAF1585939.1 unnamed protein product [Adineta ricciae]